jgi:hypothetical protein
LLKFSLNSSLAIAMRSFVRIAEKGDVFAFSCLKQNNIAQKSTTVPAVVSLSISQMRIERIPA